MITRRRVFAVLPFRATFLAAIVALASGSLQAHHPPATTYRTDERATVDGVIVSIVIRSPHSFIEVQAPDRQQHMRLWAVECGDSRAIRALVEAGALKPGDRVVITGQPARDDGQRRVRLLSLVRPSDGWQWREATR